MQIAVLTDESGMTIPMTQKGKLTLYRRKRIDQREWQILKECDLTGDSFTLSAFRKTYLENIKLWLGDCRILVLNSIDYPYLSLLEAASIHVWELPGAATDFLDYVEECERHDQNLNDEYDLRLPSLEQTADGEYSINISVTMSDSCPVTSKQLLLPFLKEGNFRVLKVISEHIPRWFDKELPEYHLSYTTEMTQSGYVTCIRKND